MEILVGGVGLFGDLFCRLVDLVVELMIGVHDVILDGKFVLVTVLLILIFGPVGNLLLHQAGISAAATKTMTVGGLLLFLLPVFLLLDEVLVLVMRGVMRGGFDLLLVAVVVYLGGILFRFRRLLALGGRNIDTRFGP